MEDPVLQDIRIVLVAPKGPVNMGAVARVCANFEAPSLWLVAPRCDPYDGEVYKVGPVGIWETESKNMLDKQHRSRG